jgi:predicted MFS family arabinose efflux permease
MWGGGLALAGSALVAASPSLPVFYAAHTVVGVGVAALLSAGFAGVAAYFGDHEVQWAMGYVVAAQALSWIVGNPIIGVLNDAGGWRLAYVVPCAISLGALLTGLAAPRAGAAEPAAGDDQVGLWAVVRDPSARRWTIAELVAYSAWTAEITYAGAFYIQTYGVSVSTVGLLLAVGSFAFMATTLNMERLTARVPRRTLIVFGALAMGSVLIVVMNVTPSVWFTVSVFCLMAFSAGVRTVASSALALDLLPDRPGSMMAARTIAAQGGYMLGAVLGGVVLAVSGFGALGFVLFGGMAFAAWLFTRVQDPTAAATVGAWTSAATRHPSSSVTATSPRPPASL